MAILNTSLLSVSLDRLCLELLLSLYLVLDKQSWQPNSNLLPSGCDVCLATISVTLRCGVGNLERMKCSVDALCIQVVSLYKVLTLITFVRIGYREIQRYKKKRPFYLHTAIIYCPVKAINDCINSGLRIFNHLHHK